MPIHDYWKDHSLTVGTFVGKVMSLLYNVLSRFIITSAPRSNCFLISWPQSPFTVILEPRKKKSATASLFPCYFPCSYGVRYHDYSFLIFSFKLVFSHSSFTLIKRLFTSSLFSVIRVVSSTYLRLLLFLQGILILACNIPRLVFCTLLS